MLKSTVTPLHNKIYFIFNFGKQNFRKKAGIIIVKGAITV